MRRLLSLFSLCLLIRSRLEEDAFDIRLYVPSSSSLLKKREKKTHNRLGETFHMNDKNRPSVNLNHSLDFYL